MHTSLETFSFIVIPIHRVSLSLNPRTNQEQVWRSRLRKPRSVIYLDCPQAIHPTSTAPNPAAMHSSLLHHPLCLPISSYDSSPPLHHSTIHPTPARNWPPLSLSLEQKCLKPGKGLILLCAKSAVSSILIGPTRPSPLLACTRAQNKMIKPRVEADQNPVAPGIHVMSHETHGKNGNQRRDTRTKKKYFHRLGNSGTRDFSFSSVLFSESRGIPGREWRPN
jgi:hypothetical protein